MLLSLWLSKAWKGKYRIEALYCAKRYNVALGLYKVESKGRGQLADGRRRITGIRWHQSADVARTQGTVKVETVKVTHASLAHGNERPLQELVADAAEHNVTPHRCRALLPGCWRGNASRPVCTELGFALSGGPSAATLLALATFGCERGEAEWTVEKAWSA